jgi:altronate dehydratase small subunit
MAARCFRIHPSDNVATLLDDVKAGEEIRIIGSEGILVARDDSPAGHKLALCAIERGAAVIKFGIPIGHASAEIAVGAWVHLHNLASNYDARSQSFDLHTGSTTDTTYV